MPNLTFYFSNEMFRKISELEFRSEIAKNLFEEYFRKTTKPDLKEISAELAQVDERKKVLEETKTAVQIETQVQEMTEKQRFEREQRHLQLKVETVRSNVINFFPDFTKISKLEQDKLIDEYLYNNPDELNIIQFFSSKGFKDNIPEEPAK